MSGITAEALLTTAGVLLAVFAAIATIDKAMDIIKKWRTPSTDTAKKLAEDKRRLDGHEEAIKVLQNGSQVQCTALMALLDHELHNGNADQMEKAKNGITVYLSSLINR